MNDEARRDAALLILAALRDDLGVGAQSVLEPYRSGARDYEELVNALAEVAVLDLTSEADDLRCAMIDKLERGLEPDTACIDAHVYAAEAALMQIVWEAPRVRGAYFDD